MSTTLHTITADVVFTHFTPVKHQIMYEMWQLHDVMLVIPPIAIIAT